MSPSPSSSPVATLPAAEPVPGSWLAHVPVPLFAVVMGVTGLGIAWRKAHAVLGLPSVIGEAVLALAAILFCAIAVLYGLKALRHPLAVVSEFRHPVRSAFFPTMSIGLLLLSIAANRYSAPLALVLWGTGAAVHLGLTLVLVGRWLTKPVEIIHSNPAWFIPVVGNIIVPVAGVPLGQTELSWFFYAIGLVFWGVLFTVVFYRLVFHAPLPVKIVPTLFILVAPPAMAFLATLALSGGEVTPFARVLFHFGLFLTLLLATLARTFLAVPFAVSWWAYTFPLDAIAVAALDYSHAVAPAPLLTLVAGLLLIVATVVVAVVLVRTALALTRGHLFVPE